MKPRNELNLAASRSLLVRKKRKNKYRAVRTVVNGISFHSKREADYYRQLVLLGKAGKLRCFKRQVRFDLTDPRIPSVKESYVADFFVEFYGSLRDEVHEVKGFWTPEAKRKWKKVQALYPQYLYRVIR